MVITYHGPAAGDTAAHWGVTDYEIQVWDPSRGDWKTVVDEHRGRAMMTRVHRLPQPLRAAKFRVLIKGVAADDEIARLLQIEAWGRDKD